MCYYDYHLSAEKMELSDYMAFANNYKLVSIYYIYCVKKLQRFELL